MRRGDDSPWGPIQAITFRGQAGIAFVSTASHGGFYVPSKLLGRISAAGQEYAARWSGSRNWFEEDCAAALVVVAFPELFTSGEVASAREVVAGIWRDRAVSS